MNFSLLLETNFQDHLTVLQATRTEVAAPFARLCKVCIRAIAGGKKIVLFGNGGSAADAQHIAAELVIRYRMNRAPIAAIALTTDSSVLTAGANDFGYETIFSRQVQALCRAGDVAIGISTSGRSPNVIAALKAARELGSTAAALTGAGGGELAGLADPLIAVPSTTIARIQEMHITLGHVLCEAVEQSSL